MRDMSSMTEVGVYTVEDLNACRERHGDGWAAQLIQGELIVSPSPGFEHQVVSGALFSVLDRALPVPLRLLSAPLDVQVDERTVVQPDLLVLPRAFRTEDVIAIPPVLVVEILSPSSRGADLVRKPEVLARFGVEHYWVVDPVDPAIRVFRLVDGTYESGLVVSGDELFETGAPFPVSFRPADLAR